MQLNPTHLERPLLEATFWSFLLGFLFLLLWGTWVSSILFVIIGGLGVFMMVYAGWIEPRWIKTSMYRFPLVADPRAWVKVVFISDLHAGTGKGPTFFARVAARIQTFRPDLFIVGGDLIEERARDVHELAPLEEVQASLGKYFILGNHDFADRPQALREAMEGWGFRTLDNRALGFEKEGQSFEMLGLEDSWYGLPEVSLLEASKTLPRLLVIHEPDGLLDLEAGQADLAVMGHTHGGQVRLPIIGSTVPLPQAVSSKFDRGLHEWKGIPFVVSQGIGESTGRARFLCRPEIVVMELGI